MVVTNVPHFSIVNAFIFEYRHKQLLMGVTPFREKLGR